MAENELLDILALFFDAPPVKWEIKNTSHGESDFREAVIAEWGDGSRYVLKLADNDFTSPEKIAVWQRSAEEYRRLGYYTPAIIAAKAGGFPVVSYKGHSCAAYAEEYSKYGSAEDRKIPFDSFMEDIVKMTARVAAARFDFSEFPSGYCLFERFCESDKNDEVTDNALEWKEYADTLPEEFRPQTERIWRRWQQNRAELEPLYKKLPTSVFQADLNESNILVDDSGKFVGVFDFNLCGRDVLLNYLFREFDRHDPECIDLTLQVLRIAGGVYRFNDEEIAAMPLIYRCVKPLWSTEVDRLKAAGGDRAAIRAQLDKTEYAQTMAIEFSGDDM